MRNVMAKAERSRCVRDAAASLFAKACLPECDNPKFAVWLLVARLCSIAKKKYLQVKQLLLKI
jgi:hypothetical protein